MLRLRPYKHCDAEKIAAWVQDENVYLKWGGKLIGEFPLSAETIDRTYTLENGKCEEPDNFYPWVALDEGGGVVGHFIMRYLHGTAGSCASAGSSWITTPAEKASERKCCGPG